MTYNQSLNYILLLISFSKEKRLTLEELVDWYHNKFKEIGFYEFQMSLSKEVRYSEFVKNLVNGRKGIYKHVKVVETDTFYEVTSSVFLVGNTIYFDVLGVSKEEFHEFAEFLIKSHAKSLEIPIDYIVDTECERITVYKLMGL
ncbi:hypothetical protein [Streptococcus sp.]